MGLFGKKKQQKVQVIHKGTIKAPLPAEFEFDVAGFEYYHEQMLEVLELNPNYKEPKRKDKSVFKYKYFEKPCDLIPEPKNQYDKNAILVSYDGKSLGHVPASMTSTVKMYLKKGYFPVLSIRAGHYKVYEDDEWVTYKKDPYAFVTLRQ